MSLRKPVLLAAAFAALLLLIAASAIAVWQQATRMQRQVGSLHRSHFQAGEALANIRANVYLNGILTRDYLVDPDPSNIDTYTDQFNEIREGTERSFKVLEAVGQDEPQRRALEQLRLELDAYWQPIEIALDWSPEEKAVRRSQVLRQRVKHRQEIFTLTRQVENLMSSNFGRERHRIEDAEKAFSRFLTWSTGAAIVLGLLIAGTTLAQILRFERQSARAESELRRLSGQLRTAQEQERKYLSRELHDQVGQMLTGLRMELASLARLRVDPEVASRVERAKSTTEQTLRIVRDIAMLLRPSMLDDLGLAPALAWQVKEFSRATGISAESDVDDRVNSLPDQYLTCLYRVVQEALTNCARHSGAHHVSVEVRRAAEAVVARITDDGVGLATTGDSKGIGLIGMEERVRELGGRLSIISGKGSGTKIEVRIPISPESDGADDTNSDRGRPRHRQDRIEASA